MRLGKWIGRFVIALGIALFLAGILILVFFLVSRTVTNDYTARVQISLDAAAISDRLAIETPDGDKALGDDSYNKLRFYLSTRPALALFARGNEDSAITLRIGDDTARISPLGDDGTRAVVFFQTGSKTYRVIITGNRLWGELLLCTDENNYAGTP